MQTKAETIMKDIYGKILDISTIAAIATASVSLLLMNFSKTSRIVDESRAWVKRIVISWLILNGLDLLSTLVPANIHYRGFWKNFPGLLAYTVSNFTL